MVVKVGIKRPEGQETLVPSAANIPNTLSEFVNGVSEQDDTRVPP